MILAQNSAAYAGYHRLSMDRSAEEESMHCADRTMTHRPKSSRDLLCKFLGGFLAILVIFVVERVYGRGTSRF